MGEGGGVAASRNERRIGHYERRMATYALIHGAGDVGWYWHLVENELRARGHNTVAPDLPCDDDASGLPEYASVVVDAIGHAQHVVWSGSRSAASQRRSSASGSQPTSSSCSRR
jgi:hypothetical protein